jgi:acetylornithine aminotransferase
MRGVVVTDSSIPPGVIVQAAMDEGLLLVAAGSNVVRFVPPLIISADEIDAAMAMFEAAVAKVVAKNKDAKP